MRGAALNCTSYSAFKARTSSQRSLSISVGPQFFREQTNVCCMGVLRVPTLVALLAVALAAVATAESSATCSRMSGVGAVWLANLDGVFETAVDVSRLGIDFTQRNSPVPNFWLNTTTPLGTTPCMWSAGLFGVQVRDNGGLRAACFPRHLLS